MTRQLMETVRFAWHDDDLRQLGQPAPLPALDGPQLALVDHDAA